MSKEKTRETVEVALKSTFEAVAEMNADHEEFERALTAGSIKRRSMHVTSIANHVQGIYSCLEATIETVMKAYGMPVPSSADWHRVLLSRAVSSTPPIITEQTYAELDELRAFRHAVRVKYGSRLDERALLHRERAELAARLLRDDLDAFFGAAPELPLAQPAAKRTKP
jgi:hypothetical protein